MAALQLTINDLRKAEMEYHGNFGPTLGRVQKIALMSRIETYYTSCHLETPTVSPTLPGFQGLKRRIKYLVSNPHKSIFYPSTYYDGSNVIILKWSGNQVED